MRTICKFLEFYYNNLARGLRGFNQSSFETFDGRSSSKEEAIISSEASNKAEILPLENETDVTTSHGTENRKLKSFCRVILLYQK